MDDASLDDFREPDDESESPATTPEADTGGATAQTGDGDEAAAEPADGDDATDTVDSERPGAGPDEQTSGVTSATTTYAWSASGATCEDCGEGVERRWDDGDGGLVCAECKVW